MKTPFINLRYRITDEGQWVLLDSTVKCFAQKVTRFSARKFLQGHAEFCCNIDSACLLILIPQENHWQNIAYKPNVNDASLRNKPCCLQSI